MQVRMHLIEIIISPSILIKPGHTRVCSRVQFAFVTQRGSHFHPGYGVANLDILAINN